MSDMLKRIAWERKFKAEHDPIYVPKKEVSFIENALKKKGLKAWKTYLLEDINTYQRKQLNCQFYVEAEDEYVDKVKRKAAQFREQYQTEDSFHIIDEEDNEETMDPLEEAYQESVNMSLLLENEKFKDVAKILTTDQFQYESINDYLNWVKRQGITVAQGHFGFVFMKEDWDFVVKFFILDNAYKMFARYQMQNSAKNSQLPKILVGITKIPTPFKSKEKTMHFLVLEKLNKTSTNNTILEAIQVLKNIQSTITKSDAEQILSYETESDDFWEEVIVGEITHLIRLGTKFDQTPRLKKEYETKINHIRKIIPNAFDFLRTYLYIIHRIVAVHNDTYSKTYYVGDMDTDIHNQNIMMRSNGELVITDPLKINDEVLSVNDIRSDLGLDEMPSNSYEEDPYYVEGEWA